MAGNRPGICVTVIEILGLNFGIETMVITVT